MRVRGLNFATAAQASAAAGHEPAAWLRGRRPAARRLSSNQLGAAAASVLTLAVLLIHGYHPYAEDAGLYLADVEKLLHPRFFQFDSGFVTADLHLSLFAQLIASLVRLLHLPLMMAMLLLYLASVWTTLFAAWQVAVRCFDRVEAWLGATCVLALCLTMPIAGTSLMLMDPYVSARSISTPCSLLAIAFALDLRSALRHNTRLPAASLAGCALSLAVAGAIHPLMAGYALSFVLLLLAFSAASWRVRLLAACLYSGAALLLAAALNRFSAPAPAHYAAVAMTRTYWFLANWHWYELTGLAGPLAVLALLLRFQRGAGRDALRTLNWTAIVAGLTGFTVALCFAQKSSPAFVVARLQPLRIFQLIYVVMLLEAGSLLGRRLLRRNLYAWAALIAVLGGLMYFVQAETFPASNHVELPWAQPKNQWEQGFLWIRAHTPSQDGFALDAFYIDAPGEDAQNFRAIAERSALPDYAKDGGIASIAPALTPEWLAGESAQVGLDNATDAQRLLKLSGKPVQWIVLSAGAATHFACPYRNGAMKVCRLPGR